MSIEGCRAGPTQKNIRCLRGRLDGRAEDHQETVTLHKDGRRVTMETGIKTI
jgi:hypothetical protein